MTMPRLALLPAAIVALLPLAGCGGAASTAADPVIARAQDDEEREGLTRARDDIDAEMRPLVEARDAEIERLRKENEDLQARIAARRGR